MIHLSSHYRKALKNKPWEQKVVTNTKIKTKKEVHPIFAHCATIENSKYWKKIFQDASVNKFYSGYSFKNDILYCRNGNQIKELPIPKEEPEEIARVCKEFFNKNTGHLSPLEKQSEMENTEENKPSKKETIKKHEQAVLILQYVDRVGDEMGYTEEERQHFYNFINYNNIMKNLQPKHFIYTDGMLETIQNIKILEGEEEGVKWKIEKPKKRKITPSTIDTEVKDPRYLIKVVPKETFEVNFTKQVDLLFKHKGKKTPTKS